MQAKLQKADCIVNFFFESEKFFFTFAQSECEQLVKNKNTARVVFPKRLRQSLHQDLKFNKNKEQYTKKQ